ncbi:LysO family transporter [Desulforamulus ruminis]|uniref:Lysine exporter LysO family protein n=1 Tax=Desulforamulus ruminis (strain ATCC 23193 / DSM 2154 / NCIMB 8452 / DL) TaxID=696281 RepID=F6DPN4_DESRL|nr:LysO family transporter [Desulforamulus ruminis]AEG59611.1 protein of unknown function DUF340 membrane [Desulforamulus ruminis DSM 2154]
MGTVLLAVLLGILVGHFKILPCKPQFVSRFTTACLFIMLVAMGAQLGLNQELMNNLHRLGGQALVLALGSILGSVLLVRLAENYMSQQLRKSREQAQKPSSGV